MLLRSWLKESFDIISIDDFFSDEDCLACVESAESGDWRQSNLGTRKIQGCRIDRGAVEKKLAGHLPEEIKGWHYAGISPKTFQVFKYTENDTFPDHQDGAIKESDDVQSLLTIVVYLNKVAGGATRFPEIPLAIPPQKGKAVIFPQNHVHNSARIEKGLKYILRGQILYRNVNGLPY